MNHRPASWQASWRGWQGLRKQRKVCMPRKGFWKRRKVRWPWRQMAENGWKASIVSWPSHGTRWEVVGWDLYTQVGGYLWWLSGDVNPFPHLSIEGTIGDIPKIKGHFRYLNWRYRPHIQWGLRKGISTQNWILYSTSVLGSWKSHWQNGTSTVTNPWLRGDSKWSIGMVDHPNEPNKTISMEETSPIQALLVHFQKWGN